MFAGYSWVTKGLFTLNNGTGLMHIQASFFKIRFGYVRNVDWMRIQTSFEIMVWVEMSCHMTEHVSHVRNYYKLSIRVFAMAGGWTAEMTHALVSVWDRLAFRVSWMEWFGTKRYLREYLESWKKWPSTERGSIVKQKIKNLKWNVSFQMQKHYQKQQLHKCFSMVRHHVWGSAHFYCTMCSYYHVQGTEVPRVAVT